MQDIKNYMLEELRSLLETEGYPRFYAIQIFNWVYKKRVEDFSLMSDLSKEARKFLKDNFCFSRLKLLKRLTSCDGTEKFLFGLKDKHRIETVLIPEGKRNTLCVSTQVGCKFRCNFCVSGLGGLRRNLKTSEIVNQYLEVNSLISFKKITNIVFMGMGEPLDNFDNTIKSIKILSAPDGLCFGKRRLCISTCGIVPKMKKLLELNLGIRLSVSLHSSSEKRSKIMPINRRYSLDKVIGIAKEFVKEGNAVTFEYILIKDFNCSNEDALKLAQLLRGINCKVNLIPYNKSEYFCWQRPDDYDLRSFENILKKYKIFFTLRKPRGQDIKAACGQLRT